MELVCVFRTAIVVFTHSAVSLAPAPRCHERLLGLCGVKMCATVAGPASAGKLLRTSTWRDKKRHIGPLRAGLKAWGWCSADGSAAQRTAMARRISP